MRVLWSRLWAAASTPTQFFGKLEPAPSRIPHAAGYAFASLTVLALACALGVARATASDAVLPLIIFALLVSSGFFLYAWAFGSLFVQRPGTLDLRAWEVTGWSWTPALFGGLSMLVPLLVWPRLALPVTLIGVFVWHLTVLRAGLAVFLERPAWRVVTLYALFIYGLPVVLFGGVIWLASRLTP